MRKQQIASVEKASLFPDVELRMVSMKESTAKRRWSDDAFEQWWLVYPRKVAKAAAKREWDRIRPDVATLERMLAALEWQVGLEQWQDENYVPHGRTYLHNRRWEDEKPTPKRGSRDPRAVLVAHSASAFDCQHVTPCEGRFQCERKRSDPVTYPLKVEP